MLTMSPAVTRIFETYPAPVGKHFLHLRQLIINIANESDDVASLEETIKWQQISYLNKHGSTIRFAPSTRSPAHYGLYFHCQSRLIDTFKEIYGDSLEFEGNRAIILSSCETIPVKILSHCLHLALSYHLRKHLPLLGA
jgi:hypothetical protein